MLTQTDRIVRLIPPASFIPPLKSLKIKPKSVKGGKGATGTVTLPSACSTDVIVTLTNSNSSIASVPATVVIPGGSTSAYFPITTVHVTSPQTVTVTATAGGVTKQTKLKVKP